MKASNIYETFAPLYKMLKLFGVIPFDMSLRNNANVSVTKLNVLWMFMLWMLWTYLIWCNLLLGAREPGDYSELVMNGWHWLLIFQIASSFYIQAVNFLNRKNIGKLLQIIDEFDEMVMNEMLMLSMPKITSFLFSEQATSRTSKS